MKVIVCLKHLINERLSQLDNTYSNLSAYDKAALEMTLKIQQMDDYMQTSVVTMGEEAACKTLREAIAYGIDDAILISDRKLSGSDTMVTSFVLARAIQKIDAVKLIVCGMESLDGSTGQVGPSIAAQLEIPIITGVRKILEFNNQYMICERKIDNMLQTIKVELPAVITVLLEEKYPIRLKTIQGIKRSANCEIKRLNIYDLNISQSECGLAGSATLVKNTEIIEKGTSRNIENISDTLIEEIVALIK